MTTKRTSKRILLSDSFIKRAKLAPTGKRIEVIDLGHRKMRLRITDNHKSFVYLARFPGASSSARRHLGDCDLMTVEDARAEARRWDELLKAGIDPRDEERRLAAISVQSAPIITFESVAEDFLAKHVNGKRSEKEYTRIVRVELIGAWGARPIAEIEQDDVVELIDAIAKRPALYAAHNALMAAKKLFRWAALRGKKRYGISTSPAALLSAQDVLESKVKRERALDDKEVAAMWKATTAIGYPYGTLVQFLALTGTRLREAAEMTWNEVDLQNRTWTLPAARQKSNRTHRIPLSDSAVALLASIPRFAGGDFVFTQSHGRRPFVAYAIGKRALDAAMKAELLGCELAPWVIHDLRRTVRSNLSKLGVNRDVAELVLGHTRPGLVQFYDRYDFESEIADALTMWANRIRDLTEPPPENLIKLGKRKRVAS